MDVFTLFFLVVSLTFSEANATPPFNCSFEKDFCGWTQKYILDDAHWIRATSFAQNHTGIDNNNCFLYLNCCSKKTKNNKAQLASPVYPRPNQEICFTFDYYFHRASPDEVKVYVKKANESLDSSVKNAKAINFENTTDLWLKGSLELGIIGRDYQIIIEGVKHSTGGQIAIDNIQIENCTSVKEPLESSTIDVDVTTSSEQVLSSTDSIITTSKTPLTISSCLNRCNSSLNQTTGFLVPCDCTEECITPSKKKNNCCTDYINYCITFSTAEVKETTVTITNENHSRRSTEDRENYYSSTQFPEASTNTLEKDGDNTIIVAICIVLVVLLSVVISSFIFRKLRLQRYNGMRRNPIARFLRNDNVLEINVNSGSYESLISM